MSRRISFRSIFFETPIMENITLGSSGLAMAGTTSSRSSVRKPAGKRDRSAACQAFQVGKKTKRLIPGSAAHLAGGPEPDADRRTIRVPEQGAAEICAQLYASNARWFALRHARDGRRDRGSNTARSAASSASQGHGRRKRRLNTAASRCDAGKDFINAVRYIKDPLNEPHWR